MVLGIDPGKNGALAWLDEHGELVHIEDMPQFTGSALGVQLADAIRICRPSTAWVEKVGAMPRQGVSSTWKFAENYGVILGTLGALDIPVHHVTPAKWKASARLSSDKNASRQRACELWPSHSLDFALVKHADRAEAALIALHGINQSTKENTAA